MSKLDELLAELCPNGVEFKPIKEVYIRLKGTPITARKMKEIENPEGEIRIFAGGKTVINANEEDIPKANITRVPAVLVQSRGVIDFIYYDKPFTFKNEMWAYTHKETISVKFLLHILKNNVDHFREVASGMGSLPQISLPVTEDFKIPVPPLEVQREIVRVLDDFTLLSAELSAELSARRKQYAYYRNEILSFDISIPHMPLNDVTVGISSGKNKERLDDGAYPVYGSTGIISKTNTPVYDWQQILVARVGANAGYVHLADGKYDVSDNTLIVDVKKEHSLKYVYYLLQNMNLNQYAKGGGQPLITAGDLKKMIVPMPKRDVQDRIVNVLDNFDAICSDLNIGLPAEINARQKQYEYYRDLLLTFVETGNTIMTDRQTDRQSIIKLFWYVFGYVKVKLGDICNVIVGGEVPDNCIKGDVADEEHFYPVWGNGKDVYGYASTYTVPTDSVCISSIGANTGAVFFHKGKFTPIIRLKVLVPNVEEIDNRYLFHAVSTIEFAPKKSSVPNMSSNDIKATEVFIPTPKRQKEIADVLDRFETLCNDIENGIPAEIAARQKQYEYYRDKLLIFKEA